MFILTQYTNIYHVNNDRDHKCDFQGNNAPSIVENLSRERNIKMMFDCFNVNYIYFSSK